MLCAHVFIVFSVAPLFALVLLLLLWQCFDMELRLLRAHVFFFSGTIVCASVVIVAMAMFDMELDKKNTQ